MSNKPGRQTRKAEFRFYEELNDFLPENNKRKCFNHEFSGTPAVRDVIVSIGVPEAAIDLILVGDEPVGFSHPLQGGERVAVFPVFERFDITPVNRLRSSPLRDVRFVIEPGLDKLAGLLRLAGLDCVCHPDLDDLNIYEIASSEKRTLLSRDEQLLKNACVTHAYQVQTTDPPAQFQEIIEAFDLRRSLRPMSRCTGCNGHLRIADEADVMDRVPFAVLVAFDDFWQCEQCQHVYWKGPRYMQLEKLLE